MGSESAIKELFKHIEDDNQHLAKHILDRVRGEISQLNERVVEANKTFLRELEDVIRIVETGKLQVARGKCGKIKTSIHNMLMHNLAVSKDPQRNQPVDRRGQMPSHGEQLGREYGYRNGAERNPQVNRTKDHPNGTSGMDSRVVAKYSSGNNMPRGAEPDMLPAENRRQKTSKEDTDYSRVQQSKRASQAMVQNNPDIADLSDVNRPTKIAERFSELYDNEWTEAFEALCKIQKGRLTERVIIDILLEIVEEAYTFCQQKANAQIQQMESAFIRILTGDMDSPGSQPTEGRNLLIQYRKGIADLALDRLRVEFRDKLNRICQSKLGNAPTDNGPTAKYAHRAVELTWWMCVQDPPVYMCMSKSPGLEPSMYKAYTKSGKELDFYVWPALKLHENGGVLMKGVAQFKYLPSHVN